MKIKLYIFFSILALQTFCLLLSVNAQDKFKQSGIDSAAIDSKIIRDKARRDSIANSIVQKRKADSLNRELAKIKLQAFKDSIFAARNAKKKADSMLREQAKLAILEKKRVADSINDDRVRRQDSLLQVRRNYNDSVKFARDELAEQKKLLEKYKNSKFYKDSLANAKATKKDSLLTARALKLATQKNRNQQIQDSIRTARSNYNDSLKAVRIKINDSTKAAVKAVIDKQKASQKLINDSLLAIRKKRTDSLAAKSKDKEKKEDVGKTKEEKQKVLALKLHEAKQKEWTNEKLLKKKWSLPRRIYQNTVTRYNYFYNGRRKYYDAIATLKKTNKDDFSKPINLNPFDVQKAGSSVAGEMDSVIKKASFSTQIHDPRSKWFDNLYFLMGRASYVKNDFEGAISTFQFIANEYKDTPSKKKKQQEKTPTVKDPNSIATIDKRKGIRKLRHHPVRNEALLWLAKSYIQAEQYSEGTALLSTLEKDKNFPKRNQAELFLTKASLELLQNNTKEGIESLEKAVSLKLQKQQRARTEFLLGQLYAKEGDFAKSSAHFKKSISGKSNPEMDFYTKLFIAQNAAKGGGDKQFAIKQLDKIIKDPKYEKYQTQAYNVLASIYAEDDIDKAIAILTKSISKADSKNQTEKAIAFAELGRLYYNKSFYELAKMAYDSASMLGSNPPIDNIEEVNTRKDVLSNVVKNIKIIRKQDSLLLLSQKSEKEQLAAAKKEAERLKELEKPKESETQVVALSPGTVVKSNWYFYNNNLLERGTTEFRQKWGNRKLEDNWRRSAATSGSISANTESEEEGEKKTGQGSQLNALLAEIPKTPEQKDKANDKIMNAWYELGLIYYSQLQDYRHAVECFDTLLLRYPSTKFKKESYYSLYLNHTLLKEDVLATKYKKLLNDEFGQSEFAKLATDPGYKDKQIESEKYIDYFYDTTYLAYKNNEYTAALDRVGYAQNSFKGKPLMAKFDLLEAICNAGLQDYSKCKTNLEKVISKYPNSEEQKKANELLAYLKSNNLAQTTDSNAQTKAKTDSSGLSSNGLKPLESKGSFIYDPKQEHQLLVYVSKINGRMTALKSALSDYNLMKHDSEELSTGQNLFTIESGILTVSKFSNAVFAKIYLNNIQKEPLIFQQFSKDDYSLAIISSLNLNELMSSKDIAGYLEFYKKNYK